MSASPFRIVNIHEAKTHLSRLVDEAEQGKPFVIAKAGKPKVKVVRLDEGDDVLKRRVGFMKGMYTVPDDFEKTNKELDRQIEKLFYGQE